METTVVKGLKVIEALAAAGGPANLSDIARTTAMTKSNAHRLLKTLEDCGWVRRDPATRSYALTLRLWSLGSRVLDGMDLRAVAAPHLRALAEATGESVHLSVLENGEAVYIDRAESAEIVRAYIRVGDRAPAWAVATGRAMLAFEPEPVIAAALSRLEAFTPNTPADPAGLRRKLAEAAETGVALTFGEWKAGVIGIAAPVMGADRRPLAGVGIAGPEARMQAADRAAQIAAVRACAAAIARDLGLLPAAAEAAADSPAEAPAQEPRHG